MIGATALFKVSHLLSQWPQAARYAEQLHQLAYLELGWPPWWWVTWPCVT